MAIEQRPNPSLRQPYLFFKIGEIGCLPQGFDRLAATQLGLLYISQETIARTPVDPASPRKGFNTTRGTYSLNQHLVRNLQEGTSLLADRWCNMPSSREKIGRIATAGGASLIGLDVELPEEIRDQVLAERGRFRTSQDKIIRPTSGEQIDLIINLDGSQDTFSLIGQIREAIAT